MSLATNLQYTVAAQGFKRPKTNKKMRHFLN